MQRGPDAGAGHGQVTQPEPGRRRDGIGDRGWSGDDRPLADSLCAERVFRRWHLDGRRLQVPDVFRPGHRVVEEGPRLELAVLIVEERLEGRPADSLRRAALLLAG